MSRRGYIKRTPLDTYEAQNRGGKGIKGVRSSHPGDLLCEVTVETPVKLTERQKELLRELEEINLRDRDRHNPRSKSFMDKVRDFFAG